MTVTKVEDCPACNGTGAEPDGLVQVVKKPCKECEGKGTIKKPKEIAVRVPAGADTGYTVRIEGEGEKGEDSPGDLYFVLRVEKHTVFERHGDDLSLQKEIAFTTAALGGEVEVPTLDGERKLNIPEGTQTSTVFRIENEGIPHLDGYGKGDEYVIVKVVTPTKLGHKEKELLREFEKLSQRPRGDRHEQDHKS